MVVANETVNKPEEERYLESAQKYFEPTMRRAFRFGKRWDEGLWRILELAALDIVLPDNRLGPILDIGCGNGDVFRTVFGKDGEMSYGIDISWSDVQSAREARVYNCCGVGDARSLVFQDRHFGLVFANSVVEHVDDIDLVLSEVARVLKAGGKFIFTTPSPIFRDKEYYYWRKLLSAIGLDFAGRLIAEREDAIYHHVNIHSFPDWESRLRRVGFRQVHHYEYIPRDTALLISRFSGASRIRGLMPVARLGRSDRACFLAPETLNEDQWLEWYRRALADYFRPCLTDEGGGQAIVANI